MPETGSAIMNQRPQSSGGSIACSAIRFWGDEIGDDWPPMLAASAIASCVARGVDRDLSDKKRERKCLRRGRVRRTLWVEESARLATISGGCQRAKSG